MDENFEDIILDEEDDLNFGVESLREKTKSSRRDNTTGQNLNKDVMSLITNEEHLKPYKNTSSNQNLKKYTEEDEKELSEEYNDFEYNIEDNESGNKSQEKLDINNNNNEHQKTPFVIDENNDLYGSSSGSNDRIENNV